MKIPGYMTAREAKAQGFTHHGKYFGIPVWIGHPGEQMMVATKWAPMEYLMTAFHFIEGFILATFFPEREPMFQFLVGDEIVQPCQDQRMGEFCCKDRSQCWEPCGELGKSEKHAKVYKGNAR